MKRTGKALVALLLALTMLLALSGCGGPSEIVGTWTAEIDCTEKVTQEILEDMEDAGDYFSAFCLKVNAVFREDGTYEIQFDQEALRQEVEQFTAEIKTLMNDVLRAAVVEMLREAGATGDLSTDEAIDAAATEMFGMSYEEIIRASLGMDVDSYVEASVDVDDLLKEFEDLNMEGNYRTSNGKLHMSDSLEHAIDPATYETYTLEGNVLTLTGYVGDEEGSLGDAYPLVFTKVS